MIKTFRAHPIHMITSFFKLIKDTFVFTFLLFVLNFGEVSLWIKIGRGLFLLFLFAEMIMIGFNWWKTTYTFNDGIIHIQQGFFRKRQNHIPLHEIQNITWQTPFYYRWFNVTSLRLETSAASEESTIQLEALAVPLAEQIEQLVTFSKTDSGSMVEKPALKTEEPIDVNDSEQDERIVHFTPTRKEVIKASFLSFSFLGLIPILFIGYQEIEKVINLDRQVEGALSFITSSWLFIIGALLLLVFVAIAFGIIQTYLKYGKYEIASNNERIFIHSGVINEKRFSIKKVNVQAIQIHQSPLKKWLNFVDIKLISAGSEDEETNDIKTLYPFIPSDQAHQLLVDILPQFPLEDATRQLKSKALYIRLFRIPWFFLLATALLWWLKREWLFLVPMLFVFTYVSRYFTYRNTRFSMNGPTIQFKIGGLSTDIFITNRKKICAVNMKQSWLQRKLGLASIQTVNRAKPVYYETLQDISWHESQQFLLWYQQRADDIKTASNRLSSSD